MSEDAAYGRLVALAFLTLLAVVGIMVLIEAWR